MMRDFDINQVPQKEAGSELDESMEYVIVEEDETHTAAGTPRRKLRLSKEQSRLLEDTFSHSHTMNPKQREGLAAQLMLKPRQVEVWFQNRRARSKLKQTEIECEKLKRWFGSLTEQNRRLKKEVEELRAIKVGPPTFISPGSCEAMPASALTMCPRCERVTAATVHLHQGPTHRLVG